MASTTGIELGSDSCVLVGVRPGPAGAGEVVALHTIGPAEWPADDTALADVLRSVRRANRLPRRAAVVSWRLPVDAVDDVITRAALRPIEAAGFRIESVLTPPRALARVAGMRSRQNSANAVVWLALNTDGVAIAIVRTGELLFARTFPWKYNPDLTETKAQLLQRYTLITHLAPEVRHGIATVRASHGASVDAVVTCGDLPELRSLTMPLIEELDLEVETLDSPEGLRAAGDLKPERLMDAAPAIRLACAAALTLSGPAAKPVGSTTLREQPTAMRRATAAVALIAAVAWGVYSYGNVFTDPAVRPMPVSQRSASTRPPQTSVAAEPKALRPPSGEKGVLKPAPQAPAVKNESKPVSTVLSVPKRMPAEPTLNTQSKPVPSGPPPMVQSRPAVPAATDRVEPQPGHSTSRTERPSQPLPATPSSTLSTASEQQTPSIDTRSSVLSSAARLTPGERHAPLKEPLPQIDSILVDQERRLAIIDGVVVGVGDAVGSRSVVQIGSDAVALREPSGLVVRVHLRPRLPK